MKPADDPFVPFAAAEAQDDFALLRDRPWSATPPPVPAPLQGGPSLGRLLGFDLLEQPLVGGIAACPGEKIVARSTVELKRAHVGRDLVLMFEDGNPRLPLIMGVIETRPLQVEAPLTAPVEVRADGERQLIEAERELVLRCGDASITLTRAGKVIIKGHYILSRSTGANKIKGAAIEIN